MNFFGHAIVASKMRETSAGLVLGAMLPDFCAMVRARTTVFYDSTVQRGVALHHDTDAAFHGARDFVELASKTTAACEARGVSRGGARAVGHIGVELLLDATLLPDLAGEALYFNAMKLASSERFADFEVDEHARVIAQLTRRIASYGSPSTHSSPANVADRLVRILTDRPRLRLDAHGGAMAREALEEIEPELRLRAPHLMRDVVAGLQSWT